MLITIGMLFISFLVPFFVRDREKNEGELVGIDFNPLIDFNVYCKLSVLSTGKFCFGTPFTAT